MRRVLTTLSVSAVTFAVLAQAALAADHGEGWYGETDDKVVTNSGFILIAFFPLFVLFMTLLQNRLDKRKNMRKKAAKARQQRPEWGGGW
jgi:ABC-type nickel/cobalt efflux system permease component RcnA